MGNEFFRVASCIPTVQPGNCKANADSIISLIKRASDADARLAVFPELSVTGYTCADLFHNRQLLDNAIEAIKAITFETGFYSNIVAVVGCPLLVDDTLYNCAVAIQGNQIIAVVPKTYLPNYNEFYEKRWWQPGPKDVSITNVVPGWDPVPFGRNQLIEVLGTKIGIEICEDLWVPVPPSCSLAMAGAEVIVNLSASDDTIGKYAYLRSLIAQQSARCLCGYVYSSAGFGESSTDLVFDGKAIIAECGNILAANERWQSGEQMVVYDLDIMAIQRDRMHNGSFSDCRRYLGINPSDFLKHSTLEESSVPSNRNLIRKINPRPFVPTTDEAMAERCSEIINIQAAGLAKRLDAIHCSKLVVGVSGGLDSTLALLVAHKAFTRLGLSMDGIIGITMPGFGTTGRTYNNAITLMEQLGISMREISIVPAVNQHFKDIEHNPDNHDVTYENSQARERTQILMDVANQVGGIVLGTGDLSELALGWATYNGDHMSMYGVNVGVPKTLVKYLVRYFALSTEDNLLRDTLLDIIGTPISPELTPADSEGNIQQKTEDLVGPYDLHDFFLYYTLRYGFPKERIALMARRAFDGEYTAEEIDKWLDKFMWRFFTQQFKRSCMPDGPKVGSVCLSPRGDWRMPSDIKPLS